MNLEHFWSLGVIIGSQCGLILLLKSKWLSSEQFLLNNVSNVLQVDQFLFWAPPVQNSTAVPAAVFGFALSC